MYSRELEIDIFRCIRELFKQLDFIAIMTVLFFVAGLGLTVHVGEDKYAAVATVYAAADSTYTDATNAVTAMNAYLDVAKSYKVSQRAALIMGSSDIDAKDFQAAIGVSSSAKKGGSSGSGYMASSATIISFVATTTDPELSMAMADAAAKSFTIEMSNILKSDAVRNLDSANDAYLAINARSEAWKTRLVIAALGFVLACMLVVIKVIVDRKVRTIREATIRNELPLIGVIPDFHEE